MMADSMPLGDDKDADRSTEESPTSHQNENLNEEEVIKEDVDDVDGPTSSVGNIIPLNKLKNGWFALSTFVTVSILPS